MLGDILSTFKSYSRWAYRLCDSSVQNMTILLLQTTNSVVSAAEEVETKAELCKNLTIQQFKSAYFKVLCQFWISKFTVYSSQMQQWSIFGFATTIALDPCQPRVVDIVEFGTIHHTKQREKIETQVK